jgi:transposase
MSQTPDELVQLKAMLRKLQQENQALEAGRESLTADKKSLTADNLALESELNIISTENITLESELNIISAENITLKEKLELALAQLNLNRAKRFGVQTEKAAKGTFNEAEQHASAAPAHHKKGRQALPEELTREVTTYTIDEPICDDCGHELHTCGFE